MTNISTKTRPGNVELHSAPRRSSFAREIMLSEFGKLGHLHDDQWADHNDIDPETLVEKRLVAMWQGPSS